MIQMLHRLNVIDSNMVLNSNIIDIDSFNEIQDMIMQAQCQIIYLY